MITGAEALVAPGRIHPIYLEGKLLPLQASTAAELDLKDGQVVQALVRLHSDQPMLLLKGRLIEAPGLLPSQIGDSLWLKASQKSDGSWALQPLPAQTNTPAVSTPGLASPWMGQQAIMLAASTPLVSRIASLLYKPNVNDELVQIYKPGVLDQLLNTVPRPDLQAQWRSLQLSMAQLTPQALQQAMQGAIGNEVRLARGLPTLNSDPKALLRKLIAEITVSNDSEDQDTGPVQKLMRAVDDIEASQVQAVQAQAQQEVLFSMTLPFADANPVSLTIRRGPRHEGEPALLTVNVHSKSEDLGPVWLQTQLMNAQQIEMMMWAESAQVVQQAKSRSYLLRDELAQAGLSMRSFQVIHGSRPPASNDWTPSGRGLVVDVSA
ncbi:MAG: flagellar hook-length control protein FliK [Betaproteobacteria bacterium]|nr:flagellar hook-length control protein FliK [Betaproteobacteria bacterium]NDD02082.1 flagellar hook-length control protein FliK [Betaproteobacteria bacterium]NDD23051.1 flagellar hook-length control protein FliK [Betaproteobacteria bacterium]NDE24993.1 flagellar hook-length control protein FliK [Betaproteobacteria bacterium]NDF79852.1 flagellar hook-length control protein FliK [Betaproteobacteria bacterium]